MTGAGRKKKKDKPNLFVRIARFVLIFTAVVYAVYLGLLHFVGEELPVIGPTFETPMIAFAGFAFLLAVGFGFAGLRWTILIPLVETAYCVFMMQPRLNSFAEISPDDKIITVMSYNIMLMHNDPESVLREIKDNKPDILFLQECPSEGEYKSRILEEAFPNGDFRSENYNAVFTRYPIEDAEWLDIHSKWSAYKVTVDIDGRDVTLCDVHLPVSVPITEWQRETFGGFDEVRRLRIKSREILTSLVKQSFADGIPLVMAGDFNSRPHSMLIRTLQKKLGDTFLARGAGFGNTWSTDYAIMRIDYIFVSEDFQVMSHEVADGKGSDHHAVVAKITFSKEEQESTEGTE